MTQDEFDKRMTRNVALSDAMTAIANRMNAIANRPMGEAQPCVIQTLCALIDDMIALRK